MAKQQPNQRGYIPQQAQQPYQPQQQPYYPPQQGWPQMQQGNQGQPPFSGRQGYILPPHSPVKPQKKEPKKNNIWVYIPVAVLVLILIAGAIAALSQGGSRQPADPTAVQQAANGQTPAGQAAVTAEPDAATIRSTVEAYNAAFCPGIYVNGIHLGGMSQQEARNAVKEQIRQSNSAWSVKLSYGQSFVVITSDLMNFTTDVEGVLSAAWQIGHTGDENQRYQDMLRLQQEPYSTSTAQPIAGDTSILDTHLAELKSRVDRAPQDATMYVSNPGDIDNPFTFTDEVVGLSLDTDSLRQQLYQMVSVMQSGELDLTAYLRQTEPNVRKLDLMQKYRVRSTATTPIAHNSEEGRNHNIQHAFDFINGTKLEPGQTFSFNGVVGMRSYERGFREAPEYVSGELVDGNYGGGVCQVSTTIYQAAELALMKIGKRNPHSEKVSYADYALDATVYLTKNRSKDFTFTNTSSSDIYIFGTLEKDPTAKKNKNKAKRVRVVIYGEDLGDVQYTLESQIIETIDPPSPEYRKDKKGEYVYSGDEPYLKSEAKPGYKANAYLVDKKNGFRQYLHTDEYPAKAAVYYVGVKNR